MKLTQFSALAVLVACTMLTGCLEESPIVSQGVMKAQVTEIDPPKHFFVSFTNVDNGDNYKEKVSKRCSSYREVKIGQIYDVDYVKRQRKDRSTYIEFTDLKKNFCPKG